MKYSLLDFLNDIAFTLEKASNFSLTEEEANNMSTDIYEDFLVDEAKIVDGEIRIPKFGDPAYDWCEATAIVLAQEYCINYWE